jgi:thiamine-phosphate pyrophosphorylase
MSVLTSTRVDCHIPRHLPESLHVINASPAPTSPRPHPFNGLYLITPDDIDTTRLLERVDTVLDYAALLQYRNKAAPPTVRRVQAEALRVLCASRGVGFIVNDDLILAEAVAADGVHLGEHDGDLRAARIQLGPDAIIGVSCYDDLDRARAAAAQGASYVAFGTFFPSATKPLARRASLDLLRDSAGFGLPRVAIGGITPDNAPHLVDAGADMIAVISGVFDAPDPTSAARAYRACFDRG